MTKGEGSHFNLTEHIHNSKVKLFMSNNLCIATVCFGYLATSTVQVGAAGSTFLLPWRYTWLLCFNLLYYLQKHRCRSWGHNSGKTCTGSPGRDRTLHMRSYAPLSPKVDYKMYSELEMYMICHVLLWPDYPTFRHHFPLFLFFPPATDPRRRRTRERRSRGDILGILELDILELDTLELDTLGLGFCYVSWWWQSHYWWLVSLECWHGKGVGQYDESQRVCNNLINPSQWNLNVKK